MAKMQSVFGAYAGKLQVVVDNSLGVFAPVWFKKYFDFGVPKMSLSYETVIGKSRIEAAASVVSHNASAPLRSRANLSKMSGEVASIKVKRAMSETDYREYLVMKDLNVDDVTKKTAILDYLFEDVKTVGNAGMKRLDMMTLQAISTGKISLTATNNPDGIATGDIDLLMPATNFKKVAVIWATSATATPISDIKAVVQAGEAEGKTFAKMLMTRNSFWAMQKCTEAMSMLSGYFRMGNNQKMVGTLDQYNEFLTANGFPIIELVNEAIGIETDGVITVNRPFNDTSVVFIPDGKLGQINCAIPIEQMQPVDGVAYATFEKGLISKWSENDPWNEFTAFEMKAFPGVETIDRIFIMDIATAA